MIRFFFFMSLISAMLLSCSSCVTQNKTSIERTSTTQEEIHCDTILPYAEGSFIKLNNDIDLGGKVAQLLSNITLIPGKGVFKNGSLVGNDTKSKGVGILFENVKIHGSWIAKEVSTRMFENLEYENSLADVLALSNSGIYNNVYIGPGEYSVSAKSFLGGLYPKSNSHIIIDGTLRLIPNDYQGCYVIFVDGCQNVIIEGKGCIYGDKYTHKGDNGQWGHGINIYNSKNFSIRNLSVKDCWGDCIYVGENSESILIDNCCLDNGRRQGVSVTSANHVQISNTIITNIAGSDPQYGIDIEPNEGDTVDNVIINNVQCLNCVGGITSWKSKNARIGKIKISNCIIKGTTAKRAVVLELAEEIEMKDCVVYSGENDAINATRVDKLTLKDNKIISTNESPLNIIKCGRSVTRNNTINKKNTLKK